MLSKEDFLSGITGRAVEFEIKDVGIVKVKGLSTNDVMEIQNHAKGDDTKATLLTIVYGLVEPTFGLEEVTKLGEMTPGILKKISERISELSGLEKSAAPLDGTGS